MAKLDQGAGPAKGPRKPDTADDDSGRFSLGTRLILAIAAVSSVVVFFWPIPPQDGLQFWSFARVHQKTYQPVIDGFNAQAESDGAPTVEMFVVDGAALTRRVQSATFAGVASADVMEVEQGMVGQFFSGPLEDVAFVDLTDRLHAEGIWERVPEAVWANWSRDGRTFGIPLGVHSTLMAYDWQAIGDGLGLDTPEAVAEVMATIQTWDDFERVLRPVVADLDGDGLADRYPLSIWWSDWWTTLVLMRQAGGGTFDADGRCIVDCEANAMVMARMIQWCFGPDRIAIDAPAWGSPVGNQLRREGRVACTLAPDWMLGIWKQDLPDLAGRYRIMPLPAWEPGGRRCTLMGGTMVSILKTSRDVEQSWAFIKALYLSRDTARRMYEINNIVVPIRDVWDDPVYAQPEPYCGGQQVGRMFIEYAGDVPFRSPSPFRALGQGQITEAMYQLKDYAESNVIYDADALLPEARRLLAEAAEDVKREMSRNAFLRSPDQAVGTSPGDDE